MSITDTDMEQLIEMEMESLNIGWLESEPLTQETQDAMEAFEEVAEELIAQWELNRFGGPSTDTIIDREDWAFYVLMTLQGSGVGIWDGRYDDAYPGGNDDVSDLSDYLQREMSGDRAYTNLEQAIHEEAYRQARFAEGRRVRFIDDSEPDTKGAFWIGEGETDLDAGPSETYSVMHGKANLYDSADQLVWEDVPLAEIEPWPWDDDDEERDEAQPPKSNGFMIGG